jgi:putative ABC transport system permease protein
MLKSYFILALKVLKRRKFYTFISLFGIAFTLSALMIATSFVEDLIYPKGAEKHSERTLTISRMSFYQEDSGGNYRGRIGYAFIKNDLYKMESPELVSGYSENTISAGFLNGVKIESKLKRTDANYWRILDFDFIEGRPFGDSEDKLGDYVAVINRTTKNQYFGQQSALGKSIKTGGVSYIVIGVVENESDMNKVASADIWIPMFATKKQQFVTNHRGGFGAMLQADDASNVQKMKHEYATVVANYHYPMKKRFPKVYSNAESKFENFARNYFRAHAKKGSGASKLMVMIVLGMVLFMFLPTINLINLNISRIMERSAEIGVRKSFGASSKTLVAQFMVENLVLTLIGGLLGFVCTYFALMFISESGLIAHANFTINLRVFGLGLLLITVFGLMSGLLPAVKMSRLHPVDALKGVI